MENLILNTLANRKDETMKFADLVNECAGNEPTRFMKNHTRLAIGCLYKQGAITCKTITTDDEVYSLITITKKGLELIN